MRTDPLPLMRLNPSRIQCPAFVVFLGVTASVGAAQFHVSPTGNDSNPGTLADPLATLQKAQTRVRERLKEDPAESVEVVIHGGAYVLRQALSFGPEDGGGNASRVTWKAASGDTVRMSGGVALTGWQVLADGTWQVQLPDEFDGRPLPRELFINRERRPRARHPNKGFLRIEQSAPDRRTGFTFQAGDVPAVPDVDQVELVFLHDWSVSRVEVAEIDVNSRTLTTQDPIGCSTKQYEIDHFEPHPRYFLENSRAYLDHPGEWHLDPQSRMLRYVPIPGERPDRVESYLPLATRLLEVRGTDDRPVVNLHFEGLHFEHCAWALPVHGYAGGQAGYHEDRSTGSGALRESIPAAIQFERTENCSMRDGSVAHLGTSGLWIGSRCRSNLVAGMTFIDISGNGVLVGEGVNRSIDGGEWWRVAAKQAAAHNSIRDCRISFCGRQFFGAVGIWVGLTRETLLLRNEVHDQPYTGISVGWRWNPEPTPCRENCVTGNHISHVMQVLSDGGGIYTLGRQPGTVLRRNIIHDVPRNAGRAESNGIFLDEGSTGIVVEENVIYDIQCSPLRFHQATTNVVRNNLLVVQGGLRAIRTIATPPSNIVQESNIVARVVQRQP